MFIGLAVVSVLFACAAFLSRFTPGFEKEAGTLWLLCGFSVIFATICWIQGVVLSDSYE